MYVLEDQCDRSSGMTCMTQSSSNTFEMVEIVQEYPYPSHVCAPNFVNVKLSGKDKYNVWRTQMMCLLVSHGMLGFIDGTFVCPKDGGQSSMSRGKEIEGADDRRQWTRSDALVKGWILGSLSEQVLVHVVDLLTAKLQTKTDFTAKNAWDKLQSIYGPHLVTPFQQAEERKKIEAESRIQGDSIPEEVKAEDNEEKKEKEEEEEEKAKKEAEERAQVQQELYVSIMYGNWKGVQSTLATKNITATDKISINDNTVLHLAVGTGTKKEFLEKMLDLVPANTSVLEMRNSDGSTVLHVAAIVGNKDAAEMLVARYPELLLAKDHDGCTPLARALSNMHINTFLYLLDSTKTDIEKGDPFAGKSGDELLVNAISSKDFCSASALLSHYRTLNSDVVLMAMAENFPHEFHIIEMSGWSQKVKYIIYFIQDLKIHKCLCVTCYLGAIILFVCLGLAGLMGVMMIPGGFLFKWYFNEKIKYDYQAEALLRSILNLLQGSNDPSSHHLLYTNPVLEATRLNAYEVVEVTVSHFPNAIWCVNEDGHNIIQCAVINRSEKVYNLLFQMSEHKNIYKTIKDSSGNNLLHLAARLAPANKLALISGAALQIQRELQWFQEVKGFVCPLNIIQQNSSGETPQMVFSREHKDLVIEGEKWMKTTAESYTITAALITTVVFAAAITVPGGNNQDSGIPIFTKEKAFTIFAVSDAVALYTSTTSLFMFLSILTARFAEQDFLFKLPTKLIIGLVTLFISTTAMIIAFGATLFLLFGQNLFWNLFLIAALTSLPITSFVTLQFSLIVDLMSSTYGSSIFGKISNRPFF